VAAPPAAGAPAERRRGDRGGPRCVCPTARRRGGGRPSPSSPGTWSAWPSCTCANRRGRTFWRIRKRPAGHPAWCDGPSPGAGLSHGCWGSTRIWDGRAPVPRGVTAFNAWWRQGVWPMVGAAAVWRGRAGRAPPPIGITGWRAVPGVGHESRPARASIAWSRRRTAPRPLQEEHERVGPAPPQSLSAAERTAVAPLAHTMPARWHASTTTGAARQARVRQSIHRGLVAGEGTRERLQSTRAWVGGGTTGGRITRPMSRPAPCSDDPRWCARRRTLAPAGYSPVPITAGLACSPRASPAHAMDRVGGCDCTGTTPPAVRGASRLKKPDDVARRPRRSPHRFPPADER